MTVFQSLGAHLQEIKIFLKANLHKRKHHVLRKTKKLLVDYIDFRLHETQ